MDNPVAGALLDLNSTNRGGLLLSNVIITDLKTIPGGNVFAGIPSEQDTNTELAGTIVYHTGSAGIPAGIYVWNGMNWMPASENCRSAKALNWKITASATPTAGVPVTFSVSSDASARCAEGEEVTWSVAPNTVTDTDLSSDTASITFSAEDTYVDLQILLKFMGIIYLR
jgi:hypothetical protein